MKHRLKYAAPLLGALGFLTLGAAGCGGPSFGGELAARPKAHVLSRAEGQTLRLPQDGPFSIVLPSSTEKAGLGGTANAHATADKQGSAAARAEVTEAGAATGEFQLGHAFRNDTERQLDLNVAVSLEYEYAASADDAAALPDARIGLKLYATDDRNRTLSSHNLVQHTTEDGSATVQSRESVRFALTLAPGEVVNVYVAGLARAEIKQGRSASGSLKVSSVQIEAETRPAPPVRTAGDEQS